MEHRGTARTRAVPVVYEGSAPEAGAPVTAGERQIGTMGSGAGGRGVALLRLDRVADAMRAATRCSAAACRSGWSSRTGRGLRFPANEGCRMSTALLHPTACSLPLAGKDDPLYVAYHDEEWGVPEYDDRALYEKLVLDGFQAGLSWITILRKRENFRRAFDGFEPEKIARYTPAKIARLMQDAGIVRNRAKIEGAVRSARAYLEIMEKGPGFSALLWDFVDGKPKVNHFRSTARCRTETALSRRCRRNCARGFKFVGPTIVYAFMQAVGMVNDHLVTCHRHEPCTSSASAS